MISVHLNEKGKYASAVYHCFVPGPFSDEDITRVYPRAWGKSVSAFGRREAHDMTEFYMHIVNRRQTTRADVLSRLPIGSEVQVLSGLPGQGAASHPGSPRTGTRRRMPNAPYGRVIAAR